MTQYRLLFSNDAATTLAAGINAAATALQVVSGGGAEFPQPTSGPPPTAFIATLIKNGNPSIKEVVRVAARSGDAFSTLTRDVGGTGALTWNAGDTVALLQPSQAMSIFAQLIDLQAQSTNFVVGSGSSSVIVGGLNPTLNASVVGMPIRVQVPHDNAAGVTFSDGINTAAVIIPGIGAVPANAMRAGGIYTFTWDGVFFELSSAQRLDMIGGQLLNGQVPSSAVVQWEAALVIAFSQLTGQLQNGQIAANIALPGSPTTTTQGVGNSGTALATTAFVNPGSSVGSYRRDPDGNIDQWGFCNPNGGTISVTFPLAFPTACDSLTFGQVSSGPTQAYSPPGTLSRTGFQVANTGGQTYWRARGH